MNDAGLRAEEAELSTPSYGRRLWEVFRAFLPLGWIAFGGPQTQIALLQERFVEGRRWLDGRQFMELLGLGQACPVLLSRRWWWRWGGAGRAGGRACVLLLLPASPIHRYDAGRIGRVRVPHRGQRPDWFDGLGAAAAALMAASAWRLGRAVVNTRLTMGYAFQRDGGDIVAASLRVPGSPGVRRTGHGHSAAGPAPSGCRGRLRPCPGQPGDFPGLGRGAAGAVPGPVRRVERGQGLPDWQALAWPSPSTARGRWCSARGR